MAWAKVLLGHGTQMQTVFSKMICLVPSRTLNTTHQSHLAHSFITPVSQTVDWHAESISGVVLQTREKMLELSMVLPTLSPYRIIFLCFTWGLLFSGCSGYSVTITMRYSYRAPYNNGQQHWTCYTYLFLFVTFNLIWDKEVQSILHHRHILFSEQLSLQCC